MAEKLLNLYSVGDTFQYRLFKGGYGTTKIIEAKEVIKKGKPSVQYALQYDTGKVKHLSDAGISDRIKKGLWKKI